MYRPEDWPPAYGCFTKLYRAEYCRTGRLRDVNAFFFCSPFYWHHNTSLHVILVLEICNWTACEYITCGQLLSETWVGDVCKLKSLCSGTVPVKNESFIHIPSYELISAPVLYYQFCLCDCCFTFYACAHAVVVHFVCIAEGEKRIQVVTTHKSNVRARRALFKYHTLCVSEQGCVK